MIKELAKGISQIAQALSSKEVHYMFVGGVANSFYGNTRPSSNLPKGIDYDIDVWYHATISNHTNLCQAIQELDASISKELLSQTFNPRKSFIKFEVDNFHFDFLPELALFHHNDFMECYSRRERGTIEGVYVDVISKEHLLLDKQKLARDKDKADIEALKTKSYKGFAR
ncbi:MAG: hypothetical protein RID25_23280 [Cyclobacteriaceae bacterium]